MTRHIMVNKSEKKQNVARRSPSTTNQRSKSNNNRHNSPNPEQNHDQEPVDELIIEDHIQSHTPSPSRKSVNINANSDVRTTSISQPSTTTTSRVLRTVFLPNEKTDALMLQVESMRAQFEEQYRLFEEKESTLMEEKRVREEEERLRAQRDSDTIQKLQTDLQRVENTLTRTTREYFVLSFRSKVEERKQKEQIELLKAENANLIKQIELLKTRTRKEMKHLLNTAREESEEVARHFRQQAIDRDNDVITLQDQLVGHKEKYEAQIRATQKKLFLFESKYKHLSSRRAIDLEGFNSEVSLLRKHMQKLESKLAKAVALSIPAHPDEEHNAFTEEQQTFAKQLELLKSKLSTVEKEVRKSSK